MLKELQAQAKENGAKVKVGVVIFNKEAHKSDFMDLETQYDAIEAAIRENISSGTNLSAGILAGKKMLDEDTQVAAGRKSLVLLSDGITYIFGEKPTAVAWGFENDGSEHSWAGPDHWSLKYGNNEALSKNEWNERLGTIKAQMDNQGDEFDHSYEQGELKPCTPPDEGKNMPIALIKHSIFPMRHIWKRRRNSITAMRCRLVHLLVKAIHGDRAL